MTIIKWTSELPYFPFHVLSGEILTGLRRTHTVVAVKESALKLFECYCDLTGTSLATADSFREAVLGFAGAMSGTDLVDAGRDTRNKYSRFMIDAYNQYFICDPNYSFIHWNPHLPLQHAEQWQALTLPTYKLRYWRSWSVMTRSGKRKYFPFPSLFLSYGEEFSEKLHTALMHFFAKQSKPVQTPFKMLFTYLIENKEKWPEETFQDPDKVDSFFDELMTHFFTRAKSLKLNIPAHIKLWNTFTKNVYECFIDTGLWARPYFALSRAPAANSEASESHVKFGKNGALVRTKLMTDIPLSVTDKVAIELLFKDIKRDVDLIKSWATAQTSSIIAAMHRRNSLAKHGNIIFGPVGVKSIKEIGEENICATFASHGYRFDRKYINVHFGYDTLKEDLAALLAIPTRDDIYPFQCLLTANHQQITPSFLEGLVLYNKNEQMTGFVETDNGHQLVGRKLRKGKYKAPQKIDLLPEMATLVKELIDLTAPLRQYLKAQNNDSWRYLFISATGSFGHPKRTPTVSWNSSRLKADQTGSMLKFQFAPFTDLSGTELLAFLKRVSLTTIRVSCAVADYLEHNNLGLLAKSLGHDKFNSQLLKRYLPSALWDFFQTRWVRVFQCAYICEAMKESKHLLRATGFSSMSELHDFLGLHALKEIPESLSNPEDDNKSKSATSKIYIAVNEEILTTLLSLEKTVRESAHPEKVNGHAIFWAKLGKLTVAKIQEDNDETLKQYLISAQRSLEPSGMEGLIYELS